MDGHVTPLAEASPTIMAGIGFLTCIDELILEQVLVLGESGLTLVTGEASFPREDLLMVGQEGGIAEVAASLGKCVGVWFGVSLSQGLMELCLKFQ